MLLGLLLAGAIGTALAGRWQHTALLGLMGLAGLVVALTARRRNSRDITRVNAIEYRDERDRRIAREGFSVVGAVALALPVVEVVAASFLGDSQGWGTPLLALAAGHLVLLSAVWAVANHAAAARH